MVMTKFGVQALMEGYFYFILFDAVLFYTL